VLVPAAGLGVLEGALLAWRRVAAPIKAAHRLCTGATASRGAAASAPRRRRRRAPASIAVLVGADGASRRVAASVEAAEDVRRRGRGDLGLGVHVGALAPEPRVAADRRRLKAAGHLTGVALNVLVEAVCTVTAARRAVEEAALLRLTVLIQMNLLVAGALTLVHGAQLPHRQRLKLLIRHVLVARAVVGTPVIL